MASPPKEQTDFTQMRGTDKAAALLLAIGEEGASKIFSYLDHTEIRDISHAMSNLGVLTPEVVDKLCLEFVQKLSSSSSLLGTHDVTERMLGKLMDKDSVLQIMDEIRGPVGRTMWDKLGNVSENVLAHFLKNEYPQTVAVVLSKIRQDHAAKVLAELPDSFALEVMMRMLRLEPVNKDVLDDIERTLRGEFMTNLASRQRRDMHEILAEIFNHMDRNSESKLLGMLEERNVESAQNIRNLMFTFEDLSGLDNNSMQKLIRVIDKEKLALALKGASQELKEQFFGNMSARAGKLLSEDIDNQGPVRVRDVEEAQTSIVLMAKDLANKGEIIISDGGADEVII